MILPGQTFGFLTATAKTYRVLSSGRKMQAWLLRCECGAEVVAMTTNLTKGKHRSCGCKRARLSAETSGVRGYSRHPAYSAHRQMIQRCHMPSAHNYRFYGARGISVCDRWRFGEGGLSGFECFLADMGERPEGKSLDRIENDGDYRPGNCQWSDALAQAKNQRPRQRVIKHRLPRAHVPEILARLASGKETQWEIARAFGVSQTTISDIKRGRICAT